MGIHMQCRYHCGVVRMQGKYGKGKRQLDCAGVVTTTLALVQRLAEHEQHADLRRCGLQVHSCTAELCVPKGEGLAGCSPTCSADTAVQPRDRDTGITSGWYWD